ncbi:hypothetical protein V6N13_034341 [Hibiscus sabdariffa]
MEDVKPFVNLMHFDQPEALQNKYGGFLNHSIVKDSKDYAEICFKTFGDRVKNWGTINEPLIIAKMGHALGIGPPGRCSDRKMCPSGYTEKSNDNIPISQTLKDDIRIDFVQKHLYQTQTAIKNGVNVKGYFYYGLIDSFEWGEGYTVRYGLYLVDFKNLTRSPKKSAKWPSRRQGDEEGWRNGYEGHGKMKDKAF